MIGRLAEISLPQPVDDCLKVLGTMLCSGGRHGAVMGSFWQPSNLLGTSADESDKVQNSDKIHSCSCVSDLVCPTVLHSF